MTSDPVIDTSSVTSQQSNVFRLGIPITEYSQDELGRLPFALSLAQSLKNQSDDQAIVLAVCGDWGSGKSSVLALVKQALETEPIVKGERVPVWLPFNPWQWNGADALVAEYFQALASAVEKLLAEIPDPEPPQLWRRLIWRFGKWSKSRRRAALTAQQIKLYGARFAVHVVFLQGYSTLLAGLSGFIALLAGAGFLAEPDNWGLLFASLSAAIITVLGLSKWGAEAAEKLAAARQTQHDAAARSPRASKEELSEKLRALPRPILVVMDDLDRLTADEIAAVFQLVKAQADFPNVFYLLAFSREIVESGLERIAPGVPGNGLPAGAGREFLEKIVPVLFDLPLIDATDIERLLRADIEKTLRVSFDEVTALTRWIGLWSAGLNAFFETVRDIERFINGLSFGARLLGSEKELEVDVHDFIVTEALRLFEPTFYGKLARASALLTRSNFLGLAELVMRNNHGKQPARDVRGEFRQAIQILLIEVSEPRREAVRQLLRCLFPGMDDCLREPGDKSVRTIEDRHAPRIGDSRYFPRYFRYALGPDEWSQAEVAELLEKASDRVVFTSHLRQVANGVLRPRNARRGPSSTMQEERDATRRLSELVRLADSRTRRADSLDKEYSQALALAIFDAGDALPELWTGQFSLNRLETEFSDWAHSALIAIEDMGERERAAMKALRETTGYAASTMFILQEVHRHKEAQNLDSEYQGFSKALSCFTQQSLEKARRIGVQKLEEAAHKGVLWREHRLKDYLYLWRDWGDDAAQQRLNIALLELMANDEGILLLLQGFLMSHGSATIGDGPPQSWRSWDISPPEIEKFVPLDTIRAALPRLQERIEQTLKSSPAGTSPDDIAPRTYREWVAIHLMYQALGRYDRGNRETFSNGQPEHTVLEEFKTLWRELRSSKR